jgi:hypothetical protein
MARTVQEEAMKLRRNLDMVYQAGVDDEQSHFWDVFQNKGARDNYSYAFYGSRWSDDIFNPAHRIKGECQQIFRNSGITTIEQTIEVVGSIAYGFQSSAVVTIKNLNLTGAKSVNNMFQSASSVTSIGFTGTLKINGLNLSPCPNLTKASLKSLVEVLEDKTKDTSGTEWIVTVGATNKATLTDDEWAPAKDKGWTVE